MYGFPQEGSLANKLLNKILESYGFSPTPSTPGMCRHEIIPIQSALMADGFGV